jgi:phosphoheptose isomerase
MYTTRTKAIAEHLRLSCETIERAAADRALLDTMAAIAEVMIDALTAGGKILIAGNGGGAAPPAK